MSLSILIAAGGTGGHMIPAHALSEELRRRGHKITLLTDDRGMRFPGLFEFVPHHVLPSASASGRNPFHWLKAAITIWKGRAKGRKIAKEVGAQAVVGFGGYPSLPGLLAGISLGLPAVIHEQNAVLGRVNRRLSKRVTAIALTYPETARLPNRAEGKATVTGNPVRDEILAARRDDFDAPHDGTPFRLLVTGGSQGARILSTKLPHAIALLPKEMQSRLLVEQQCRPEDLSEVVTRYEELGIKADCQIYMADLPDRMARAHLVIARAGASTMAELMAMGRPAILIPFKAATDDHQTANAQGYVAAGAGIMVAEEDITLPKLSGYIQGFMRSPEALEGAAQAAYRLGKPDAAKQLADLVERQIHNFGDSE